MATTEFKVCVVMLFLFMVTADTAVISGFACPWQTFNSFA